MLAVRYSSDSDVFLYRPIVVVTSITNIMLVVVKEIITSYCDRIQNRNKYEDVEARDNKDERDDDDDDDNNENEDDDDDDD